MPRAVSTTRFSRRVFLTVTAACVFLLACELACQVALIGNVADAALRLIVCSVVAGLLIAAAVRSSPGRGVFAAVIVFAACSTGGFALGVTRKAPSLDDAPLIGRHGTGHHILRRTLFAGSALAVGSLFLLLLHSLEEANGRLQTDVAHRRRAEALLAKREQLHRNAIASANGVAYQLEFESNTYSHMDAAIERLLGYDLSKISRDIWRNIIRQTVLRGDAATVSLEDAARAFRAGAFPVWQADYQCTAKDGSTVWLADSSVLIRDEDGTITGSLGILQDVTERKSVERELRQSEANLSDFFENATIGLHWVGPDGTILGANRAELELLGYAEGEYVGRPIAEFHVDGDVIEDILRRLSGGERLRDYEAKMRCKDGTIKTVQIDSSVLWQNGEFVHTRCFTRDITGRKQAEEALQAANDELERRVAERTSELSEANVGLLLEVGEREKAERALRESEQRYELAVRGTADGIWDWDILSGSVYRSPRVWELLGYDAEEISPTFDGFSSLLHPDDRDRAQDAVRRHLEQREPYHMEYRMRTKTGDYRWFETRGEAVWDDDGNPVRMAGSIRDITSRRAAESELRLSAEIAQNMAEGVSLIRVSDETIVFTNPRFDVLFGYEPGKLIGRHVSILNAAGDKSPEETAAEIICGVEENGSWSGEIPNVKKDGTAFWTRATVSAFEHPQHGAVWVAVQDDNTRRKKAEDRVAALGRILDDSLNEIYIFDARSLRFLQVNRGAIQNLGYALDELRELTPLDLKPEYTAGSFAHLVSPLRTGDKEEVQFETVHRRKDGSHYPVEVRLQLAEFESRPAFVAVILDITDRKQAEDAMRESEEQYRILLEDHVDGVVVVVDGRIHYVNNRMSALCGWKPEELVGRSPVDLVVPEERPRVAERIQALIRGGDETASEYRIRRKDGRYIVLEVSSRLIRYQGRPALLGVMRDITRRQKLEEASRRHRDELAHVARVSTMGEMATGLAHELNQPLAAIATYASIGATKYRIDRPHARDDELAGVLRKIEVQALRAGEIIRRLRNLVAKQRPAAAQFRVNDAVRNVASLLATDTETNRVELRLHLDDDLPSLMGDAIQIEQVILNLMRNATEAMREGTRGRRRLAVKTALSGGDRICIEVSDTGPGISPKELESVFEPFFSTKPDGMGMGLSISASIAEAHHGRLTATSNADGGATFQLTLPVHKNG